MNKQYRIQLTLEFDYTALEGSTWHLENNLCLDNYINYLYHSLKVGECNLCPNPNNSAKVLSITEPKIDGKEDPGMESKTA
jgi:hypothetical protein